MSDSDKSLDAAREALKQAERAAAAAKAEPAKAADGKDGKSFSLSSAAGSSRRTATKIFQVFDVVWNGWLMPVARFLNPFFKRVWRLYVRIYERFAYAGDAEGTRRFSRNRAAIVIAALAVFTVAAPIVFFRTIVPATSRTIYDAVMLTMVKDDRLYLGRAELIRPDDEVYQVMGCRDITGCDGGANTTYFRLRDNIILDVRNWTTQLAPYDPAEIAGAMLSELNDCTIRYYGQRVKALGWYPFIISARCVPV